MKNEFKYLKLREWLELGQAMRGKFTIGPKYFRKWDVDTIEIGKNLKVKADGKTYKIGKYRLDVSWKHMI